MLAMLDMPPVLRRVGERMPLRGTKRTCPSLAWELCKTKGPVSIRPFDCIKSETAAYRVR